MGDKITFTTIIFKSKISKGLYNKNRDLMKDEKQNKQKVLIKWGS